MNPTGTVLVFSIGPVQGFISEARRTADSWVGSYLLSYLAAHAGVALEKAGVLIIEPDVDAALYQAVKALVDKNGVPASVRGSTTSAALPNTVLVQLKEQDATSIGNAAKEAVLEAWWALTAQVETALNSHSLANPVAGYAGEIWKRQLGDAASPIKSPWEIYFAWGENSTEAFQALGSRKAVRDFPRVDEGGDRCTVCGQREALWDGHDVRTFWIDCAEKINGQDLGASQPAPHNLIRLDARERPHRRSERLCAVCLVKRLVPWTENHVRSIWQVGSRSGNRPWVFPSTSTMATLHYKVELLEEPALRAAIAKYIEMIASTKADGRALSGKADSVDTFRRWEKAIDDGLGWARHALEIDGDWYLYGEAVKNEHGISEEFHAKLGSLYRAVREAAHEAGILESPIYYAVLVMDGDGMGDFKKRVAHDHDLLTQVSKVLGEFAQGVPKIVRDEHNGRAVYCGADDLVAFLSLPDALPCAENLRRKFQEQLASCAALSQFSPLPTLSGSIVYAHHQAPLGAVIREAVARLKDAKHWDSDEKNSVALTHFRRGGPALAMNAHWEVDGEALATRLGRLVERLKAPGKKTANVVNKDLSSSIGHALRRYAWLLGDQAFDEDYRRALLEFLIGKSRLADDSDPEARRERAVATAEEIFTLSSAAGRFRLEPLLMARFLAGEGREERE